MASFNRDVNLKNPTRVIITRLSTEIGFRHALTNALNPPHTRELTRTILYTRVKLTHKLYATVLLHPPRRDLPPPSMWGNKIWNIFRYEDTPTPKNTMQLKFKEK